jgi:NAD(P)-dependent dehydrogenase (short-subunit alcohol dehydrogenase family)
MVSKTAGPRAVVTGAAAGLGRAIAEEFIGRGGSVLVFDLDESAAASAATELGESAAAFHGDVSDAAHWDRALSTAVDLWGGLDVLVNNASIVEPVLIVEQDEARFDRVVAVNLKSVMLSMKAAAPVIAEAGGGAIVNIASIAGMHGALARQGAYCATKAGVIALSQTAALELRDVGIRVNAVCPGMIRTPLFEAVGGASLEADSGMKWPEIVAQIQGRVGEPADIASLVGFLASDAATLISGAVIPVDGAISARLH